MIYISKKVSIDTMKRGSGIIFNSCKLNGVTWAMYPKEICVQVNKIKERNIYPMCIILSMYIPYLT